MSGRGPLGLQSPEMVQPVAAVQHVRVVQCARALRADSGSGSILGVVVIAGILAISGMLVPLGIVIDAKHRVGGAADAAALAAADTASGIHPGVPCAVATEVARSNGARITACSSDGMVVTVRATARIMIFDVNMMASAGPP